MTTSRRAETYERLCAQADLLLAAGESVVLDATWGDADHRTMARAVAERRGADVVEIECRLDPDLARRRIVERDGSDASDATPELVDEMERRRHPWPTAHVLDTALPVGEVMGTAVAALSTTGPVPSFLGSGAPLDPIDAEH